MNRSQIHIDSPECLCAGCRGARRVRDNLPLDESLDNVENFLKRAALQAVRSSLPLPESQEENL
jgi:hypothetical protein